MAFVIKFIALAYSKSAQNIRCAYYITVFFMYVTALFSVRVE